jgi:hypothetical protein
MSNQELKSYQEEIKNKIEAAYHGENLIQTPIEQLYFYYKTEPTDMLATVYEPSICIIVQGAKEVGFGDELIPYDPDKYLLASVHMPARVRITEASPQSPMQDLPLLLPWNRYSMYSKIYPPGQTIPALRKAGSILER